ncbi:gas vesicle protein K [Streptomyces sp. NPDC021212]|uniref:gas vesicle protein K n=1 Tax=Streptomyces sp. NPDC021212 TaxID=3365118 RepID=UPI0037B3A12E
MTARPERVPRRMSATPDRPVQRLSTDPDAVERDLAKLVLTVVELLRQLMERQALHRVNKGDLTEEQEERIGMTLMILQQRMEEMCDRHGLRMEDLNLDLGPLGTLLSPAGQVHG